MIDGSHTEAFGLLPKQLLSLFLIGRGALDRYQSRVSLILCDSWAGLIFSIQRVTVDTSRSLAGEVHVLSRIDFMRFTLDTVY